MPAFLASREGQMIQEKQTVSSSFFASRRTFYIDINGIIRMIDLNISPATAGADLVRNLEALAFPKKS